MSFCKQSSMHGNGDALFDRFSPMRPFEALDLRLDGWLDQGFTWNPASPDNRFNDPVTFNDRSNEYQMNQLYLVLARDVNSESRQWDVGGRVDLLYGTDYRFTTATGLETNADGTQKWNSDEGPGPGPNLYGLAMPQLYGEVFLPYGNGLTVKGGHFYTTLGYETVPAPQNFFYSHAYTMQYGEPFTHTGLLADYPVTGDLSVSAGFTRGWDNFIDPNDDLAFLGGIEWSSDDGHTTVALSVHTGNETALSGNENRTVYSLVFTQQLTGRLTYVLQHDFGVQQDDQINPAGGVDAAKWYGLNQYLLYEVSDQLKAGLRFEWFRDQDNSRVVQINNANLADNSNYFELTAGLNRKPCSNVTLRPELRWDWSNFEAPVLAADGAFDGFNEEQQFLLGTDLIIAF